MKKLLTLLTFSLLTLTALAVDVRLDIDDPARVEISVDDVVQTGIKAGLNTLDVNSGSYVTVAATPGNMLVSVTETNGDYKYDMPIHAEDGRQFSIINVYSDYGDTYVVVSAPAGDLRTATLALTVDNAEAVAAVFPATETTVALQNGLNSVKFNPEQEKTIRLTPTGKDFYKVEKNGVALPASYSYTVDIADGDAISVTSQYPDVDYSVTFALTGNGAEDFITAVDVDGKPVFGYLEPGFTVKAGSELKITGNTRDYEVLEFRINGVAAAFANPTTILVTDNVELAVSVRQYAVFNVTVDIDDPSRVTLYNGYRYNNVVVPLKAGLNSVSITRNTSRMALVAGEGFYVESASFTNGGTTEHLSVEELQQPVIDLSPLYDDDIVTIRTAAITRDQTAALYLHGMALAEGYFSFTRADGSAPVADLADGYHTIPFFSRDNPFRAATGAPVEAHVYLNDEAMEPEFTGSHNYNVTFGEADVLKVYYGEAPARYDVSIDIDGADDPEAAVSITRDRLQPVVPAAAHSTFRALHGTEISILPLAEGWKISVGGQELTPGADGAVTFTVEADTQVTVARDGSGISDAAADTATETARYTADGVRVDAPVKGVNIVRYSDGTVRKVIVR